MMRTEIKSRRSVNRAPAAAYQFEARAKPLSLLAIGCAVVWLCAMLLILPKAKVAAALLTGQSRSAQSSVDPLGIPYASRLSDGTSESARTQLYDDPNDRLAQVAALREDDAYSPEDDVEHVVSYAENRRLYAVCNPAVPIAPAVQCSGRRGYILHLALRGEATFRQIGSAIDSYGRGWAKIFAHYHPKNLHCALIVLESDVTAEDEAQNDDAGNGILRQKCFAVR